MEEGFTNAPNYSATASSNATSVIDNIHRVLAVDDQADDAIWILTSTFIIFTMQSGRFAWQSSEPGQRFPALLSVKLLQKNDFFVVTQMALIVFFQDSAEIKLRDFIPFSKHVNI